MANEISISKDIEIFESRVRMLESVYPVAIHLVQTVGRRRQYITGVLNSPYLQGESTAIFWKDDLSFQIYGGERLGPFAKRDVETQLCRERQLSGKWTLEEIMDALTAPDPGFLWKRADQVRAEFMGPAIYLRGLIEFSNDCLRDCLYCGLRKSHHELERYRMSPDEIMNCAVQAKDLGYGTVVLQSGEENVYSSDELASVVSRIKNETGCAVTLSVGERSFEDYRTFKEAGADRYLLKFETSNRKLFQYLKPDSSYENRIRCLHWLRELGYQVGSGCMVGLPGQTLEDLARDLQFIQAMDFDMVGIGPFLPNPKTPLRNLPVSDSELTLRMVALARILTRRAHLPATTALGTLDVLGRQKALERGANILMPNLTPKKFRPLYEIYPNKICIGESASDCGGCVEGMILSLGREVGSGPGHSLKRLIDVS